MKKLNVLLPFLTVLIAFLLISWGQQGHYKINLQSSESFNVEMQQFMDWANTLAEHASDADYRKDTDPNEAPKHYIDIDSYPGFLQNGRIPETYDSVVALYGHDFVLEQGLLPWATVITYDSLVHCFQRYDWNRAVLVAADLGHYVADGHMPLHIATDYDGQNSGHDGIHSRYESSMINAFNNQITYPGSSISVVDNVNTYIFQYLYANFKYVDSIFLADDYAKSVAGGTNSYAYKQALWSKTKSFTIPLFANASRTLAELIYTAWAEAGKPSINGSGIDDLPFGKSELWMTNYPNPVSESLKIEVYNAADSQITIRVMDMTGKEVSRLTETSLERGKHIFTWDSLEIPQGVYFLVVDDSKTQLVRKLVVTR
jgi:hypothetical protein